MEEKVYMDIKRNLSDFTEELHNNLSYFFEEQTPPQVEEVTDRMNASFTLNRQTMAESIVSSLLDSFKLKQLAGFKSNDGTEVHYVLYSERTCNKMYVVHIDSFEYGLIEQISVSFFESIEKMYDYLARILNYVEGYRGVILESMTRTKFKVDFYK